MLICVLFVCLCIWWADGCVTCIVFFFCFVHCFPTTLQMPRIWLDYCEFLMNQGLITRTRRTFDRALRALPITQHPRIWPLYLKFVNLHNIPETAVRVYRRHLKVELYCLFAADPISFSRYILCTFTFRKLKRQKKISMRTCEQRSTSPVYFCIYRCNPSAQKSLLNT